MMVAFTSDAQAHLDRYLRQMKVALSGNTSVDAQEVERDVLGHIEAELPPNEPVTLDRLQSVLKRLGSPNQWLSVEDLPLWRRVLLRLWSGPEDWRLAYLTFVCFAVGPFLGPIGPMFFLASFPLARAALTVLEEREGPIDARRWLIYPPLVLWYASFAVLFLSWPLAIVVALSEQVGHNARLAKLLRPTWVILPAAAMIGIGLWWTILGFLLPRAARLIQIAFWPFADWLERRHAIRLALVGIVVAAVGALALAAGMRWPLELEAAARLFTS
jgi:hypothetical protein